jgi:hypothetical protein
MKTEWIKQRFVICDHHGTYVVDAHEGKLVYGQGPVESLLTGHAWLERERAEAALAHARTLAPDHQLHLALVEFHAPFADPTRWSARNSRMLLG